MKLSVARSVLLDAIDAVLPAISARRMDLPVLTHVLLSARDGQIEVTANSLDLAIVVRISAEVERSGAIALPAKRLAELLKHLSGAPVRLSVPSAGRATITSGESTFRVVGLPADEFPATKKLPNDAPSWTVDASDVRSLVDRVAFAVSTEESRPILNGVLWELRDDTMRMVATDTHRLALADAIVASTGRTEPLDLIVSPVALRQIGRLCDGSVSVRASENHVSVSGEHVDIVALRIAGPYPDYNRVLPKPSTQRSVVADAPTLATMLRRVSAVSDDRIVALRIEGGHLYARTQSADVGDSRDMMPADEVDASEPETIGVDVRLLLGTLQRVPGERVRIRYRTPNTALMITPAEAERPLFLVMPIRLADDLYADANPISRSAS